MISIASIPTICGKRTTHDAKRLRRIRFSQQVSTFFLGLNTLVRVSSCTARITASCSVPP